MTFESVVSEVKGRLEPVVEQVQGVAEVSFEALKQANDIVLNTVQDLFKTNVDAGKALIEAAVGSFEKARTDGLVAVAKNPIEYVPAGRETLVSAFNDTVDTVTKTGEDLAKVIKTGYESAAAKISGNGTAKPARRARKSTRKTGTRKAAAA